jgi:hypothetical protein
MNTLAYAKRLRDGGVPAGQAEAHAEAAREFIMGELVTKTDMEAMGASIRQELRSSIDNLSLRLTVRLGGLIAIGVAVLATIIKL